MSKLYKYNRKAIYRSLRLGFILQDFMSLWSSYFLIFLVFFLLVSKMANLTDPICLADSSIIDTCQQSIGGFVLSVFSLPECLKNYALGKAGVVAYMPYYKYPLTAPVTKEAFLWAHQCDVTTLYPRRTWVEWLCQLFTSHTTWAPVPLKAPTLNNFTNFFECSMNAVCGPDGNFIFIHALPTAPRAADVAPEVLLQFIKLLDETAVDPIIPATVAVLTLAQHTFGFGQSMSILYQVLFNAGLFIVHDPITNAFDHYALKLTPEGAYSLVQWDDVNGHINLATKKVPVSTRWGMLPDSDLHFDWYYKKYKQLPPSLLEEDYQFNSTLDPVPHRQRNAIYVGASLLQPQAGITYQVVFINNLTGLPFRPN